MGTDYTLAISAVIGLVVLQTGMTAYVFSRPTDLSSPSNR